MTILPDAKFALRPLARTKGLTITVVLNFSTIGFTIVGLGEPREVRAGVVGGSYFEVMGLHPVLGRLLGPGDDGPNAAGAMVLTHRFWTTGLNRDLDARRLGVGRSIEDPPFQLVEDVLSKANLTQLESLQAGDALPGHHHNLTKHHSSLQGSRDI
jgi:hypothetical protein